MEVIKMLPLEIGTEILNKINVKMAFTNYFASRVLTILRQLQHKTIVVLFKIIEKKMRYSVIY